MGYSDDKTNAELLALEKRIKREYKKAYEEMAETAEAYFAKFEERYQKEYEAFQEGQYTRAQFDAWVETQIARGKAWEAKRDQLANIMTNANQVASELINGATPSVYALNANYTAWEVSQVYPASDFATSFDLVSADTVSNLLQDKGNYTDFKTVRVNPKRDYSWNTKQIQSALTSGILQGKSIDKLADSFMVVQKRNRNAAVRNARTAVTSAQNSGRISSMKRAQDMGIEVKKKWLSASDNRVRDSHAHLNGQIRDIDDTFDNDLLYPGDSNGIPAEVYNCRCTLTYIYPKYQNVESNEEYSEDKNKGESYQQWVKRKKAEADILAELSSDQKREYTINPQKLTAAGKRILLETEVNKQFVLINSLVSDYINRPSVWNGQKIIILSDDEDALGRFNSKTGQVSLKDNAGIRTRFHEALHGFSNKDVTKNNVPFAERTKYTYAEEAAVDLMAEEICLANGFGFSRSAYSKSVDELRKIADAYNWNYIDFAKKLIEYPASRRYAYIKDLATAKGIKFHEKKYR